MQLTGAVGSTFAGPVRVGRLLCDDRFGGDDDDCCRYRGLGGEQSRRDIAGVSVVGLVASVLDGACVCVSSAVDGQACTYVTPNVGPSLQLIFTNKTRPVCHVMYPSAEITSDALTFLIYLPAECVSRLINGQS